MKMQKFNEWLELKEFNDPAMEQKGKIQDAAQNLYNTIANMRNQPSVWLGNGLQYALTKVQGIPQAEKVIREMQNVAMQFFQAIREFGIHDQRNGNVVSARMPNKGEQGFDEYQRLYVMYSKKLTDMLKQLNAY